MTFLRLSTWTLLLAGGFALLADPTAAARDDKLPEFPFGAASTASGFKTRVTEERGGIPEKERKAAKEAFDKLAVYYADVVKNPAIYKAPQEFKPETITDKVPTIDALVQDMNRFFFEPVPGNVRVGPDQAVYLQLLGEAFDDAFRPLIEGDAQQMIVRVNAARVLAHVCRTGARKHFETVTKLLKDKATPTQVRYYLLQAAANLLAAGDVMEPKTRNHAGDAKMVYDLVEALMVAIEDPTRLISGVEKWDPATATPDQVAVARFVRRQAVKALAQVRFAVVPGYAEAKGEKGEKTDKKPDLYPVYLLARVALEDPKLALGLPPGKDDPPAVRRAYEAARAAEAAEAVIGICNMAPPAKTPKYNADVAVEVVTVALINFAGLRAAKVDDRSLPWKAYAARLAEALRGWGPLFDPDFSPAVPAKSEPPRFTPPAVVTSLYRDVVPAVLAPMDRTDAGATVRVKVLLDRLDAIRAKKDKERPKVLLEGKDTSIARLVPE